LIVDSTADSNPFEVGMARYVDTAGRGGLKETPYFGDSQQRPSTSPERSPSHLLICVKEDQHGFNRGVLPLNVGGTFLYFDGAKHRLAASACR